MNLLQTIILSIAQGITEFLPISSSGHLALLQNFWHISESSIAFNVLLHFGTLGSVIAIFYENIKEIVKNKNWQIIRLVFVATLPAAIFGFLFQSLIETIFSSLRFIGFAFLITAFFLLITKFLKKSQQKEKIENISYLDALIIGTAQAFALFPGISRSGITIVAGLSRKLNAQLAYQFSFLLAIPTILGALILQMPKIILQAQNNYLFYILGFLIAFLSGIVSLKILAKILKKEKLYWFSFYLLILGILILI